MRYLLDTNVLSELRKPGASERVFSFVNDLNPVDTFASVISLGEMVLGMTLLPEGLRKRNIAGWLRVLESSFGDRLLPCDVRIARIWGEASGAAKARGINIPTSDGLIAATALSHGLHLLTRNVHHFEPLGVLVINPWD